MEKTLTLTQKSDAFLQSVFGETFLGVGITTISFSAFLCGVALFYLVMIRQWRRNAAKRAVAEQ